MPKSHDIILDLEKGKPMGSWPDQRRIEKIAQGVQLHRLCMVLLKEWCLNREKCAVKRLALNKGGLECFAPQKPSIKSCVFCSHRKLGYPVDRRYYCIEDILETILPFRAKKCELESSSLADIEKVIISAERLARQEFFG